MTDFETKRIYHGDNLYYLPKIPSNFIDLIYIDPPFGTQSLWRAKGTPFKKNIKELQFYDIFGGGLEGYIKFLTERLKEMHRILKPTGSLFVHLDWRMSHYIKVELDKIFGVKNPASSKTNFVNEIVWCYKSGGIPKRNLSKKHDVIFWYSKRKNKHIYNKQYAPYSEGTLQRGLTNYKKNLGNYSLSKRGQI